MSLLEIVAALLLTLGSVLVFLALRLAERAAAPPAVAPLNPSREATEAPYRRAA